MQLARMVCANKNSEVFIPYSSCLIMLRIQHFQDRGTRLQLGVLCTQVVRAAQIFI